LSIELFLKTIHTVAAPAATALAAQQVIEFGENPEAVFFVIMQPFYQLVGTGGEMLALRHLHQLVKMTEALLAQAIAPLGVGQKVLGWRPQTHLGTLAIGHVAQFALKAGLAAGAIFGFVFEHGKQAVNERRRLGLLGPQLSGKLQRT
jgi:hypothetical protein